MKPKNTDRQRAKRAAARGVGINALLQLLAALCLLYLGSITQIIWLRRLALALAALDLIPIPFSLISLRQRLQEIELGELDEARKY